MTAPDLESLLALASKSPGWNFREGWAPQQVKLRGGCTLTVLTPLLWRGRALPTRAKPCLLIPLRRRA